MKQNFSIALPPGAESIEVVDTEDDSHSVVIKLKNGRTLVVNIPDDKDDDDDVVANVYEGHDIDPSNIHFEDTEELASLAFTATGEADIGKQSAVWAQY
jgi:hypothetical protein